DEEDRIGFLFRSLEGKAYKTLETYLLTKTKDNSLSYEDFCSYVKDSIRTDKATFRDKEDRIGFLFCSLEGKARKTLETRLLTKTKDDSLSYEDFCGYVKDSAIKRLDAELVLPKRNYYSTMPLESLSSLTTSPPLLSTPSRSFCLRRLYLIGRSTWLFRLTRNVGTN
ncbi:hypothetical protein L249_8297, partial [Ophiocordyceps polyrhachis-furcata BCC 54312]